MGNRSKKKNIEKIGDIQIYDSMLKEFDNASKEFDNVLKEFEKIDELINDFKLENFDEVRNALKLTVDRGINILSKVNKSVGATPLNDEMKKIFEGSCKIQESLELSSKQLESRERIENLFNIYQISCLFNKYSFLYLVQEYDEMKKIIELILKEVNGEKIKEIVDKKLLDNDLCLSSADGLLSSVEINMILNEDKKEVIDEIVFSCYEKNREKLLEIIDAVLKKLEVSDIINDTESSKIINGMYARFKKMLEYSKKDEGYFKDDFIVLDGLNKQILNCEALVRCKVNHPDDSEKWYMKQEFKKLMNFNCGENYENENLFEYFKKNVYMSVSIDTVNDELIFKIPKRHAIAHGLDIINDYNPKRLINSILFVSNVIGLKPIPRENI